jgi:hypothetical protein
MPYSTKLMLQELMALGIYVKLILDEPAVVATQPTPDQGNKFVKNISLLEAMLKDVKQQVLQGNRGGMVGPSHKRVAPTS